MHPVDRHRMASEHARQETIKKYGPNSVPVTPGTKEHAFWLGEFDKKLKQLILSAG